MKNTFINTCRQRIRQK